MSEEIYTCIWCQQAHTLPAARFGSVGWACPGDCYSRFMQAYWRVKEPERYGRANKDEREHVRKVLGYG